MRQKLVRILSTSFALFAVSGFAEDSDCDIKKVPWNSFVAYEHDQWPPFGDGSLLATDKITPLLRTSGKDPRLASDDNEVEKHIDKKIAELEGAEKSQGYLYTGQKHDLADYKRWKENLAENRQPSFNISKSNDQSQEILKFLAPHNSGDQIAASEAQLNNIRVTAGVDFGDIFDSFPCEAKNLRICAYVEPLTEFSERTEDNLPQKTMQKLYRRVTKLRIETCLSDYPMATAERQKIDKACNEPPKDGLDRDRGYAGIRLQFIACRDALKAFMDTQKNLPLDEHGKYVPKEHK